MENNKEELFFFQGTENLLKETDQLREDGQEDSRIEKIRAKITDFLCMKNVNFLLGSGTSSGAIATMKGLYANVKTMLESCDEDWADLFDIVAANAKENLEEVLGLLYCKQKYYEGIGDTGNEEYIICNNLIKFIEEEIRKELSTKPSGAVLETYKNFYKKLSVRSKDLSRLNIFTTNNDLFNEYALDALNINYIDGFTGGLKRFFNPAVFNCTLSKRMDTSIERFEPVENMVYLYKIHGSVNWKEVTDSNSYFTIRSFAVPLGENRAALIYPTPLKQNKSLGSPYVDLFREFQHKLLEPNSVLFVMGYSFSDEHVNDVIYRALATNTTFNLVIIDDIDTEKPICKIDDKRIFRIFSKSEEAGHTHLHYFSRTVEEIIPNQDYRAEDSATLEQLNTFLKELKNKKK